jgi:hypothetical protein
MPENARDFNTPIDKIGTTRQIADEITRRLSMAQG